MTATTTTASASRGGVGEGDFGVARQHPTDVLLPDGLEELLLQLTRLLRHREVVDGHLRDWNETINKKERQHMIRLIMVVPYVA